MRRRDGTLKWWVAPTPSLPTFSNPSLPYEVLGRLYPTMAKNASSRGSMNPLYEGDKEESTVFNLNHQLMAPALGNWQLSNSYPSTSWDFRDASTIDLEGRHRKALAFKYSSYRAHKDPKCLGKQVVRLSTKKIGRKGKARSPLFLPSSFPWTFPAECFLRARTCCNAPTPHCWTEWYLYRINFVD